MSTGGHPKARGSLSADEEAIISLPSINTSPLSERNTRYAYTSVANEAVSCITADRSKRKTSPSPSNVSAERQMMTYKISFLPRNAIKGQVLADFLSDAPDGEAEEELRAGLVLIGPSGLEYTYALRLTFVSTNNEAEYKALLAGLRIARKMRVSGIEVKVDSKLVANQINGTYEATKESMIKYLAKAKEFISEFKTFSIENIPRKDNQKADILSKLATIPFSHITKEILVEVLNERSTDAKEVQTIMEEERDN
ncbi:reverse transcriptase domain-containing protein [Tanacetum coccineum]